MLASEEVALFSLSSFCIFHIDILAMWKNLKPCYLFYFSRKPHQLETDFPGKSLLKNVWSYVELFFSLYLKVKIDGLPIPKGRLVKGPYKPI